MLLSAITSMGWQATALIAVMMLAAPNVILLLVGRLVAGRGRRDYAVGEEEEAAATTAMVMRSHMMRNRHKPVVVHPTFAS